MNYYNMLWFFVLIRLFGNSLGKYSSESGSSQLFIGRYPIPSETPAPLNIDTNKVKNVNLPPLVFEAVLDANAKVVNNGESIKAIIDQTTPAATISGGPLNGTYIFHETNYFWSGNLSGPAGTLIDGKDGVPLEPVAFWYNQKYGSFENSKNYRDGMAATAFPVVIRPLFNLLFVPFSNALEKVRESGSHETINLAETFFWFDGYLLPNTPYYSYPGSYQDKKNSKLYYCATVIRFIPRSSSISKAQFEKYFLTLKDSNKKQLINAIQSHPQQDVPVIKAEGQLQIFIPLGNQIVDITKLL